MDPAVEKRHHRAYAVVWITMAVVIGAYLIAVPIAGLAPHVIILLLAPLPGAALLAFYVLNRTGFRIVGEFEMDDGQILKRTVSTYLPVHAKDERFAAELHMVLQDLQTCGYQFADGHGRLTKLLNQPGPTHRRLIVQGDFRLPDNSLVTRTISCPLRTQITTNNSVTVRDEILQSLRSAGHVFPEGHGTLHTVHVTVFV